MRLLPDWVDSFVQYTEGLPSPLIFRKWGAIAAVAGALERRVWLRSMNLDLYPHLYTFLVGPPGVGKSVIIGRVEELWRSLTAAHVAPKSMTAASLIDSLAEAKRTKTVVQANSMHLEYNSLLSVVGELSVFLPTWDGNFMGNLTGIWDGDHYEERRRGHDRHIIIKKPQLNILGGTTPSYLNGTIPEGAWDQGFLSRTFLVYSGEPVIQDIFAESTLDPELFAKLRSDLRDIFDMAGQFAFLPDAQAALRAWHLAGGPPRPEHPKLVHYLTRRTLHLLKLCMVASASERSDKVITLGHYQTALNWLLEMEGELEQIFKALGARGDGQVIEEAYHFLYRIYMSTKEPIQEHRLIGYLAERVPSYSVSRIVEVMERSGQIEKRLTKMGVPAWVPVAKQLH